MANDVQFRSGSGLTRLQKPALDTLEEVVKLELLFKGTANVRQMVDQKDPAYRSPASLTIKLKLLEYLVKSDFCCTQVNHMLEITNTAIFCNFIN